MSQNSGFRIFCWKIWSGFTSVALHAHWGYFQRCVKYGTQRPNFGAILVPKVRTISGVWSLSQKVFTGFTTVLLHMLIRSTFRCVVNMHMGLRGPILGPLWAPNKSKFRSLVIFSKIFHWLRISLGVHVNLGYFYKCVEYWPQRPNFRVIWTPKYNIIQVSNGFTFSFNMLIGGTSMYISIMRPKGSISGPRVKVAAEPVMPSGLLYRKGDLLHYNVINWKRILR